MVQKVLIPVLLFLTYVFGLGLLRLLACVFARGLLATAWERGDSFWITATTAQYKPDADECRRQS